MAARPEPYLSLPVYWQRVAEAMRDYPNWRFGQAAFNVLSALRPDLSEPIRGQASDPFHYRGGEDDSLKGFVAYLENNW